ncbi:rod shape-determining protein [Actinomadura flavalba]|uniref:rod shape-determining protein n=1 Tax=Actinomadura flavalba TaxID=1120938 RepID=UPI00052694A1|nr:rod shape-determining protein [Actinomadura flavalba]
MNVREFPGRGTALDIGSHTLRMHVAGRGIVASEPTALARCRRTGRTLAIGAPALEMAGTRGDVELVRPVRAGVPSDSDDVETLVRRLLRAHHRAHYLARPHMAVTAPSVQTPLQRRTIEEVAFRTGARKVTVVPKPLAAAIGAGLDFDTDIVVVADIGAHVTDVGIVAFGGLVSSVTAPVGGAAFDHAIASWLRDERGLLIGDLVAETAKLAAAELEPRGRRRRRQALVHGKDVRTGLPRGEVVTTPELERAIQAPLQAIIDVVQRGLAECPPDMAGDLVTSGLTLTGAGARLPGLDRRLRRETGVQCNVAGNAPDAAVEGAAALLALPRSSVPHESGAREWGLLSMPRQLWPARS